MYLKHVLQVKALLQRGMWLLADNSLGLATGDNRSNVTGCRRRLEHKLLALNR